MCVATQHLCIFTTYDAHTQYFFLYAVILSGKSRGSGMSVFSKTRFLYFCSMENSEVYIIIVAAGRGQRFGSDIPKQFCDLRGRPVLMHAIDAMRQAFPEASMGLALNSAYMNLWHDLCRKHNFTSPRVTRGGLTRAHSVRNALGVIPEGIRIIGIHDGARPLASPSMVRAVAQAVADGADGALPALPPTDSLRRILPDGHSGAVDRSMFRTVQTPQFFRAGILLDAYGEELPATATDDASVVEAFCPGADIVLVDGDHHNIKITQPGDLKIADLYMP